MGTAMIRSGECVPQRTVYGAGDAKNGFLPTEARVQGWRDSNNRGEAGKSQGKRSRSRRVLRRKNQK